MNRTSHTGPFFIRKFAERAQLLRLLKIVLLHHPGVAFLKSALRVSNIWHIFSLFSAWYVVFAVLSCAQVYSASLPVQCKEELRDAPCDCAPVGDEAVLLPNRSVRSGDTTESKHYKVFLLLRRAPTVRKAERCAFTRAEDLSMKTETSISTYNTTFEVSLI